MLLPLLYLLLFVLLIYRMRFFRLDGISSFTMVGFFLLKIIFGVALYYIYTYHYTYKNTSDAYKFFYDGITLHGIFKQNPLHFFQLLFGINTDAPYLQGYISQLNYWFLEDGSKVYNDSRTVIRFNAVTYFFSRGNYHVHTIFMCFLSFAGLTALYRATVHYFGDRKRLLAFAIYLLPSVLFWSSGVLKEGVVIFTMGFFMYAYFKIMHEKPGIKNSVFFVVMAYAVLLSKFYVIFAFMPGVCAGLLSKVKYFSSWSPLKRYVLMYLIGISGLLVLSLTTPVNPLKIIANKQRDFINVANGGFFYYRPAQGDTIRVNYSDSLLIAQKDSAFWLQPGTSYTVMIDGKPTRTEKATNEDKGLQFLLRMTPSGSKIDIPPLEPTVVSFLKNIPLTLVNCLARPFITEVNNLFSLFSALENLMILLLLIPFIFFFARPDAAQKEFIFFALSFSLLLFMLIGLTTPVVGALVRYKIPAMPFFVMAIVLFYNVQKIIQKFPFTKGFIN